MKIDQLMSKRMYPNCMHLKNAFEAARVLSQCLEQTQWHFYLILLVKQSEGWPKFRRKENKQK